MAVDKGHAESLALFWTTSPQYSQFGLTVALALISLEARFGFGSETTAAEGMPTTRRKDASPTMPRLS